MPWPWKPSFSPYKVALLYFFARQMLMLLVLLTPSGRELAVELAPIEHDASPFGYATEILFQISISYLLWTCLNGVQPGETLMPRHHRRVRVQPGGFVRPKQKVLFTKNSCILLVLVMWLGVTNGEAELLQQELDIPLCMRKAHEDEAFVFIQSLINWTTSLLMATNVAKQIRYAKSGRLIRLAESTQGAILKLGYEKRMCSTCKQFVAK